MCICFGFGTDPKYIHCSFIVLELMKPIKLLERRLYDDLMTIICWDSIQNDFFVWLLATWEEVMTFRYYLDFGFVDLSGVIEEDFTLYTLWFFDCSKLVFYKIIYLRLLKKYF